MLDKNFIDILACPLCKSAVSQEADFLVCTNKNCRHKYRIVKGIPIMLAEDEKQSIDMRITAKKWHCQYELKKTKETSKADLKRLKNSVEHIKKYWHKTPQKLLLEAGCGDSVNSFELAKEGIMTVGLDISFNALEMAKDNFQKAGLKSWFVCGDMLKLPFKNDTFSFIYAGGSIEHFRNTEEAVSQLRATLECKGILSALVPMVSLSSFTYYQLQGQIPDLPIIRPLAEFIHINILKEKLMKNGYEKSFTIRKISNIFKACSLTEIEAGFFKDEYDIKYIKNDFLRRILKTIATWPIFWPIIYVNGTKRNA